MSSFVPATCTWARADGLCGRALSEEQETADQAQHLARLRSQLSLSEAAVLYRRARTVAVSARDALCSSGDDRPIELKDIETRADWTQAR